VYIAKVTSPIQTVFALQEAKQLRGEPVAELVQSILQLGAVDATGSIAVKVLKDALPILMRYRQMFMVSDVEKACTPLCISTGR
jgi:hypothetical protein